MIAIAKAVSYGVNDLRYITGESNKKKHRRLEEKVILSRVLKRNTMLCVHPFAVDLNL